MPEPDVYWGHQPHIIFRLSLGALGVLFLQAIVFTAWLVTMHGDLQNLKGVAIERGSRIETIDAGGSRALMLLGQRVDSLQNSQTAQDKKISDMESQIIMMSRDMLTATAKIQNQMDVNSLLLRNINERQDRFSSALDNTWSLLNEHMRDDSVRNPRLNLPERKK